MKSAIQDHMAPEPSRASANNTRPDGKMQPAVPILQKKALPGEPLQPLPVQQPVNNTGLPDNLKTGVEQLSGFSLNDVKVHYNSDKPAQLQAFAYAQGSNIHIAPGQEKHLPHEAWHVAQQKQGRVQATLQTKGIAINDDKGLEQEADIKGAEALAIQTAPRTMRAAHPATPIVQRVLLTKEDVFEDQIKWAVVLGVANIVDPTSGDENGKKLVDLLAGKNIVNPGLLVAKYKATNKVQRTFYKENKAGPLFSTITLKSLQAQGLVMDAVTIVEMASASWDLYKADISDKTGSKEVEGYSGKHLDDKQVQIKTKVKWESVEKEQGKGVTASVLAPDHPLGSPPTNKKVNEKVRSFAAAAGKDYIAGHLLNNNLGGPGNDEKNLTAIPMDVNSEMSTQVESKVVERVNKNHEVVYYKVDVEYDKDPVDQQLAYASRLTIEFGSYKKGIKNFDNVTAADLGDKYTYVIPIHSPSKYKADNKGYSRKEEPDKFIYTDEKGGKHEWVPAENSKDPAKLKFKKDKHIILKNTTQVKLEFISFAIYALKIGELEKEIAVLKEESKLHDSAYDDLKIKYADLGEEAKKVKILLQHIQNIKEEFEEEKKEMREEQTLMESEVSSMNEAIAEMEGKLKKQELEAKQQREALLEYIAKARERAEPLGFMIGYEDGSNGRPGSGPEQAKKRRVSFVSETPFMSGYNRGYGEGREKIKRNEELGKLSSENEELKKEHSAKDEEIRKLQEMIKLLQQPQAVKVAVSVASGKSDEKEVKQSFDRMVKDHCHTGNIEEGMKWLNGVTGGIKVPKFQYLAMLIHLDILTPELAYKIYPAKLKYNTLFRRQAEREKVFYRIKELYEER